MLNRLLALVQILTFDIFYVDTLHFFFICSFDIFTNFSLTPLKTSQIKTLFHLLLFFQNKVTIHYVCRSHYSACSFQSLRSTTEAIELEELHCSTPSQTTASSNSIVISSPQFSLKRLPYSPSNNNNHQLPEAPSSYQLATSPLTVCNCLSCPDLACNINKEHLYFGNCPEPEPGYPLLAI